ncbi:MAG: LLM class flavin-dependent oxidoreductase [Bacteroidetes bacterium]|nr:LLM class flavin-dependent oxidoreductase [Bacteroidota bacterium]
MYTVKFSLFFEIQMENPSRERERSKFHAALEQAKLADSLGYHAIWVVEHHGMLGYSHSSAPEVLLGCLAGLTQNVKLGHGVALTPFRYNHPIRIAERIATLDILSGGRAMLGMGKSASLTELEAFENDKDSLQEQWLEALDMIPRMWSDGLFSYKSRHFDVPPTHIVPKPVQDQHPPLFAACNRPEASIKLGELGLGALNFAVGDHSYLSQLVQGYRLAAAQANPAGRAGTNHFCCAPITCCLPNDREASRHGFKGARFFEDAMSLYYFQGIRPRDVNGLRGHNLDEAALQQKMDGRGKQGSLNLIGDPHKVRDGVALFAEAGVDELILLMQVGTVPDEVILRSIATMAESVFPYFPDKDPVLQEIALEAYPY